MKWMSIGLVLFSAVNAFASEVSLLAPVLAPRDFAGAKVEERGGATLLNIQLSAEGARKLRDYSSKHVGEGLAVVLDDRVIGIPKLRVPITGNVVVLDAFEKKEATQIANAINVSAKR